MTTAPISLCTFNINGIRAHSHQIDEIKRVHAPTILGLQEIKVSNEDWPHEEYERFGWAQHPHGQKGRHGVAYFVDPKAKVTGVTRGWPEQDEGAKRMIMMTIETDQGPLHVLNGYFPNGESRNHEEKFPDKRAFYANLLNYLETHCSPNDQVVVMGDFNVAHTDQDIGLGESARLRWLKEGKCAFLPEEREWYQKCLDWGLHDLVRVHAPDEHLLTWYHYMRHGWASKRGLRIDTFLGTKPLTDRVLNALVDLDVRGMEKPSDHAPLVLSLQLSLA